MPHVFTYATLKSRQVQDKALGHDAKIERQAILPGYTEIARSLAGGPWPTIIKSRGQVRGEVLSVKESDLEKLDAWESRYMRIPVILEDNEKAWVYMLKPYI